MVPDPVGAGSEHEEMFWNHTPTLQHQEKNFLLIFCHFCPPKFRKHPIYYITFLDLRYYSTPYKITLTLYPNLPISPQISRNQLIHKYP